MVFATAHLSCILFEFIRNSSLAYVCELERIVLNADWFINILHMPDNAKNINLYEQYLGLIPIVLMFICVRSDVTKILRIVENVALT